MLIVTKARLELPLGRFRLLIDEMAKLVSIRWVAGDAPGRDELKNIETFLRYSRPDIMSDRIRTGWGVECLSAPIAMAFRANTKVNR